MKDAELQAARSQLQAHATDSALKRHEAAAQLQLSLAAEQQQQQLQLQQQQQLRSMQLELSVAHAATARAEDELARHRAALEVSASRVWILKCLQGGRAHPLAACGVATLCCSPPGGAAGIHPYRCPQPLGRQMAVAEEQALRSSLADAELKKRALQAAEAPADHPHGEVRSRSLKQNSDRLPGISAINPLNRLNASFVYP
jgi:hypothetical protein